MCTVINRMGQDCGHARQLTWRGGETGWWSTLMWLPTGSAVVRQHHLDKPHTEQQRNTRTCNSNNGSLSG